MQPGTSDEDMRQSLHFVVVGGGPTGERRMGHHAARMCMPPAARLHGPSAQRCGRPRRSVRCAPHPAATAGVEFAGTLSDFLREDLRRKYPELMPYVQVTLLNSAPTILGAFDEK